MSAQDRYNRSPKGKASRARYAASAKGKATQAKYKRVDTKARLKITIKALEARVKRMGEKGV